MTVTKIIVNKILSDEQTKLLEGTILPSGYYNTIIDYDCDVFTEDGNILLRFRKNVLPIKNINKAYDSLIKHAQTKTTTRGIAAGNNGLVKLVQNNNKIQSNIIGYFDTLSVRQKWILKDANIKQPKCRQTAFTGQQVDKWNNTIPLIKDINKQYKLLLPKQYKLQHKIAHTTNYVIDNTAFSTLTINLNLQTALHTDKGDFKDGFGNLIVIEKGKYKGGYTGFPQYGIAVDVRNTDFLAMDVHQLHGNEPIIPLTPDAERLSIVSYLRQGIVDKCKNEKILDESFFIKAKKIAHKNRNNTLLNTIKNKFKSHKNKTVKKIH